jgi:hypothetical protein
MSAASTDGFSRVLWRELEAAKLIPDPGHYSSLRPEITHSGKVERNRMASLVGEATWQRMIVGMGSTFSEGDCVRVLGFGRALTEFAIAPLHLPEPEREAVNDLGVLANFLVAIYDHLVDVGKQRRAPLLRWELRLAARSQRQRWLTVLESAMPATSKMMNRLVAAYYQDLSRLPFAAKHAQVHKLVRQAIVHMYDAEGETLKAASRESCSQRSLQRKSALPFVVMGLPAWMTVPALNERRYWWHLRWLYRLGLFFGWVDDAIDLDEDLAAGRPNLINRNQTLLGHAQRDNVDLARAIASRGVRILDEWRLHTGDLDDLSAMAREAFSMSLVSWFGGIPEHA